MLLRVIVSEDIAQLFLFYHVYALQQSIELMLMRIDLYSAILAEREAGITHNTHTAHSCTLMHTMNTKWLISSLTVDSRFEFSKYSF